MEVVKCGLCKEEIEYAQRCRVYIKTNEPRPYQRTSKRPHIGRYKLLSTANSTEHISFARRLKRLRQINKQKSLTSSSENSSSNEADPKKQPSTEKKEDSKQLKVIEKAQPEEKPIESVEKEFLESKEKAFESTEKAFSEFSEKAFPESTEKAFSDSTETAFSESIEAAFSESTTETASLESTEKASSEFKEKTSPEFTEKTSPESTEKTSPESTEKTSPESTEKKSPESTEKASHRATEKVSHRVTEKAPLQSVKKSSEVSTKDNSRKKIIIQRCEIVKKATSKDNTNLEALNIKNFNKKTIRKSTSGVHKSKKILPSIKPLEQNMSHPQFQNSFEEYIKPSLPKSNSTLSVERADKKKNTDMNSDSEQVKLVQATSTPKSVKNGSTINSKNSDCETYYWLEMAKPKQPESRKLGYQFDNLVAEVKHMKLPNPDWKIKIMVHKQEMVSVSFTKKLTPEKVVSVNAKSLVCDITIDAKKIVLLGSPIFIHSIKDLEIMLDIVDEIEPNSSMINYLKT